MTSAGIEPTERVHRTTERANPSPLCLLVDSVRLANLNEPSLLNFVRTRCVHALFLLAHTSYFYLRLRSP